MTNLYRVYDINSTHLGDFDADLVLGILGVHDGEGITLTVNNGAEVRVVPVAK